MRESSFQQKSFWTTMPGILTGCGAVITAIATLIGACAGGMALLPRNEIPAAQSPTATATLENHTPNVNYITVNQIHLPPSPEIPLNIQQDVVQLIVNADKAQILANFFQDESFLAPYYAGQALAEAKHMIDSIKESGYIQYDSIDLNKSYYVRMYFNNNILSIEACEYWQASYFDSDGDLVGKSELRLIPQTISFESIDNRLTISAISFYQNNAFCTK